MFVSGSGEGVGPRQVVWAAGEVGHVDGVRVGTRQPEFGPGVLELPALRGCLSPSVSGGGPDQRPRLVTAGLAHDARTDHRAGWWGTAWCFPPLLTALSIEFKPPPPRERPALSCAHSCPLMQALESSSVS